MIQITASSIFAVILLASSWAQAGVDLPKSCLKIETYPCAYRTQDPEWVSFANFKIKTQKQTSFIVRGPSEFELIEGSLWIESPQPLSFMQVHRDYVVSGEVWVQKIDQGVRILNFSGAVFVKGGSFASENLPVGFANWWDLSKQGTLAPFELTGTLKEWNQMVDYDQKQAKAKIAHYRELWKDRVEVSSDFNRQLTERRMASDQEAQDKAEAEAAARLKQGEAFRQMFHDRYFKPE